MVGVPCEACSGSGLGSRQGGDADPNLHPILSQCIGLCDACGGSGTKPPAGAHRANREAAKAIEG